MKRITVLLFCLLSTVFLNAQVPDYIPTSNLVGWWPLDSTLVDSSSNSYDGTGMLFTYATNRFGNTGKACNFGNNNAYVRFSNVPINTRGRYTINYWMKLNSYQNYDVVQDFHPGDECGSYPQIWEMFDSLYIVKCNDVPSRRPIGAKALFLNNWTMLTYSVAPDTTSVYINGVLKSKFAYSWSTSTNANLFLANASNAASPYQTGAQVTIDDLGLWDRQLTDCEIYGLFQSALPAAISTQPTTQTGTVGGSVSFNITTSNSLATYQWQSNIGSGGAFINLTNASQYNGVTNDTLTVSGLTAVNNNQRFRCIVNRTGCDTITSDTASIVINTTGISNHDNYANSVLEQNIPNPASDYTTINYHVPFLKNNAGINICDASGRKIWSGNITKAGKGHFTIARQLLGKGIYFYSLIIDGRNISTRKMIFIY